MKKMAGSLRELPAEVGSSGESSSHPGGGAQPRWHYASVWFSIAAAVIIGASVLENSSGSHVALPGGIVLPETCWFRTHTGLNCPGCGLTRSFVHMAHGRFAQAWRVHSVGPLLFVFTLLQLPWALLYWRFGDRPAVQRTLYWNLFLLLALSLLLLVRWLLRMLVIAMSA